MYRVCYPTCNGANYSVFSVIFALFSLCPHCSEQLGHSFSHFSCSSLSVWIKFGYKVLNLYCLGGKLYPVDSRCWLQLAMSGIDYELLEDGMGTSHVWTLARTGAGLLSLLLVSVSGWLAHLAHLSPALSPRNPAQLVVSTRAPAMRTMAPPTLSTMPPATLSTVAPAALSGAPIVQLFEQAADTSPGRKEGDEQIQLRYPVGARVVADHDPDLIEDSDDNSVGLIDEDMLGVEVQEQEVFVPNEKLSKVMVKPGPMGAAQLLLPPILYRGPSSIFVYSKDMKPPVCSEEEKDLMGITEGYLYGAKIVHGREPQSGKCVDIGIITAKKSDYLRGQLYLWPRSRFQAKLLQADQEMGYDSDQPNKGYLRRGIVNIVREDGSTTRAFWYYQKEIKDLKAAVRTEQQTGYRNVFRCPDPDCPLCPIDFPLNFDVRTAKNLAAFIAVAYDMFFTWDALNPQPKKSEFTWCPDVSQVGIAPLKSCDLIWGSVSVSLGKIWSYQPLVGTFPEPWGFVALDERDSVYLVIRGTVSIPDLIKDITSDDTNYTGAGPHFQGRVHTGVQDCWLSMSGMVRRALNKIESPRRLYITGHSLGAGIALLAVPDILHNVPKFKDVPVAVYTYAGIQVGDRHFAKEFRRLGVTVWRVENTADLVPKVPGSIEVSDPYRPWLSLTLPALSDCAYKHVGRAVRFTAQYNSLLINHLIATYYYALDHPTNPQLPGPFAKAGPTEEMIMTNQSIVSLYWPNVTWGNQSMLRLSWRNKPLTFNQSFLASIWPDVGMSWNQSLQSMAAWSYFFQGAASAATSASPEILRQVWDYFNQSSKDSAESKRPQGSKSSSALIGESKGFNQSGAAWMLNKSTQPWKEEFKVLSQSTRAWIDESKALESKALNISSKAAIELLNLSSKARMQALDKSSKNKNWSQTWADQMQKMPSAQDALSFLPSKEAAMAYLPNQSMLPLSFINSWLHSFNDTLSPKFVSKMSKASGKYVASLNGTTPPEFVRIPLSTIYSWISSYSDLPPELLKQLQKYFTQRSEQDQPRLLNATYNPATATAEKVLQLPAANATQLPPASLSETNAGLPLSSFNSIMSIMQGWGVPAGNFFAKLFNDSTNLIFSSVDDTHPAEMETKTKPELERVAETEGTIEPKARTVLEPEKESTVADILIEGDSKKGHPAGTDQKSQGTEPTKSKTL
eukprot:g24191.t1